MLGMRTLTPAERRALRAKAHHLDPVVSVGQHGLTPAVLHEIDVSLKAHELIKIRVFGDERDLREAMLGRICDELDAAPVQHLGKLLVVWRPAPEDEAPARRAAPAGKSAARRAPQVRRPRTPLPRAPARPSPFGKPPVPASPGTRRRKPAADAVAPRAAGDRSRRTDGKSSPAPGPRSRAGGGTSASGPHKPASRSRAGGTGAAGGARKPVSRPHGKSSSSTTGAAGARRRRKARS
jgi:putative YhbY family RNA-binding protein